MADDGTTPRAPRTGWRVRTLSVLGTLLVRLLATTWRYRVRNGAVVERLRAEGRPFILAVWHGSLLPLTYWHRGEGIVVLISEHRDGEIIARVVHALGYRTIRGSTSRGASRALLAMIRTLEEGAVLAITPDGPRGPSHVFQPGALVASQRARAPIVPIVLGVDRAWRFRSWDRFTVPKPFARVTVAYGEPTVASEGAARDVAQEVPRFTALMQAAQDVADA